VTSALEAAVRQLERKGTERELAHTAAEDELRNDVQVTIAIEV